jgi:hypothetical protein
MINKTFMKKILVAAGILFLAACNNEKSDANTTETTTTQRTYTASEGDVSYRDGKVVVYRNNAWVDADNDVTVDNGIIVRRNGRVVKDNEEYELEEGVVVTKTGDFWDKAGNAIEDGWEGIKRAFRKVKEEVKDAVDTDTTDRR